MAPIRGREGERRGRVARGDERETGIGTWRTTGTAAVAVRTPAHAIGLTTPLTTAEVTAIDATPIGRGTAAARPLPAPRSRRSGEPEPSRRPRRTAAHAAVERRGRRARRRRCRSRRPPARRRASTRAGAPSPRRGAQARRAMPHEARMPLPPAPAGAADGEAPGMRARDPHSQRAGRLRKRSGGASTRPRRRSRPAPGAAPLDSRASHSCHSRGGRRARRRDRTTATPRRPSSMRGRVPEPDPRPSR